MSKKVSALSVAAAVAGAISFAAVTTAIPAMAAGVKCYGISKKGQNDCQNKAGTHSCAGQSKVDYDGGEWKDVATKAACAAAKGKLEPFSGVNTMKTSG